MPTKNKTQHKSSASSRFTKNFSVSIIGAGRVGTAFAIALRKAGYDIDLVVAKHDRNAKRAARLIGNSTIGISATEFRRLAPTRQDWFEGSPLIIIATPDDAIKSVAQELVATLRSHRKIRKASPASRVVMHTSGALSSEVLRPLQNEGFAVGSLHPLVAISDAQSGAEWLTRSFFSLEGDAAAIRFGRRIVRDLGGQSFTIDSDAKPLYHAAALMASPNMTALFDIAVEMLARCGLTPKRSRQILLPLVKSTLDNLVTRDPAQALTGTFKRGDITTVKKHLAAIETAKLRDAWEAYLLLGRRSLSLSDTPNHNKIRRLLTSALDEGNERDRR